MTIQDKLTLLISIFGISLIVVLSSLFYREMRIEVERNHRHQLETVVDSRIQSLRFVLDLRSEQARHIADTWLPGQLSPDGNNPPELLRMLQEHVDLILSSHRGFPSEPAHARFNMPPIDRITISDMAGRVMASTHRNMVGRSMPAWMLEGVRDRGTWYGGIHHDPETARDYLLFMEPVYHSDSGRFAGMVSIRVGLEVFRQITMHPVGLGETGEVLLVQPGRTDGGVRFISPLRFEFPHGTEEAGIAGEFPDFATGKELPGEARQTFAVPAFRLMEGEDGSGIVFDYRGEEVSAVWRWLPDLDLGIVGKIDTAELYAPIFKIRNAILFSGMLILLLSLLLAWWMARSFSRPIELVADRFSRISRGETLEPLALKRSDEIGILAESANRTIDYLKRVQEHAGEIAAGNTDADITPVSEKDDLGSALQMMTENLRSYRFRIESLLRDSRDQMRKLKQQRERIIRDMAMRKELERRILQTGDEERRRIGRDLHDDLGQMLTGIRMVSENLARRLAANELPGADEVREIAGMVREADEYTRALSRGMVQIDIETNGISMALESLCRNIEKMFPIECRYEESGIIRLDNHSVALTIYRIVQESITNAVRHGECKRVEVHLFQYEHHVLLHVDDDGKGLADSWNQGPGRGVEIMKYRAGILGGEVELYRVGSFRTRVRCSIPLVPPGDDPGADQTEPTGQSTEKSGGAYETDRSGG